jgi:cellulose synthase/poly-beta-1,6-N-acetylglucosamine synthase-like glycosyltransferase
MLLAIAYAGLMIAYLGAWRALPKGVLPEDFDPKNTLSILIPARNEADRIEACLQSILETDYPNHLLEIIVLDDFSEDETLRGVQQFSEKIEHTGLSIRCLQLAEHLPAEARFTANKKKALELGVAQTTGPIILTTDADCVVLKNWLRHIAHAFEQPKTQMVCAPVVFHRERQVLQHFQSLDFLGMMGITGAGYQMGWHQMANGANLAFRQSAFENVNGYQGNQHLASGDDMFLVQKIAQKWPGSVQFLKNKDAAVRTEAMPDLRSFWQQRLRWGTKNAAMPNWPQRISLLLVFVFCWSIWLNLALALSDVATGRFPENLWVLLFQFSVKAFFDYIFLAEMCRFFNRRDLLRWFWPSFFLHTAYIPALGLASLFLKKYVWKGRNAR